MGCVDSDLAANPDTRRSVTGDVCSLSNSPTAWQAKRSWTTLSSVEAEFVAVCICGQEAIMICLGPTLCGFGDDQKAPTILLEDHASCITMSNTPVNPAVRRQMDALRFVLHDMVCEELHVQKVEGACNVADALTKSAPAPPLEKHR